MRKIMIFGKGSTIVEEKSDKDSLRVKGNKIFIKSYKKSTNSLLKEYLSDLLYSRVYEIYDEVKKDGIVEVFGDLDFEVMERIDNKKQRVAKLKRNKILVKLNAVALPKSALKYLIVHEIAHAFTKRHTKRFWKIVGTVYPKFKVGQTLLMKYNDFLWDSCL